MSEANSNNINKLEDPHVDLDTIFHHTRLPYTDLSLKIDKFINSVASKFSWVWLLLVATIIVNVVLRYGFGQGRIELEELQWHFFSSGFLIGLSYCFTHDDHVRVDILHDGFSVRTQAWVELFGSLFLLLPFISFILYYTIPFIAYSWGLNEVSDAPGGLPARWLIKSFLFIGFALLFLAVFSRFLRITSCLFSFPKSKKWGEGK